MAQPPARPPLPPPAPPPEPAARPTASPSAAVVREQLAVALRYAWGQAGAPVVVASGRGTLAERIVRTAADSGVPVRTDAGLAAVLGQVEVGLPIPPEAFLAVAEILAFLYRLDGTLTPPAAAGAGR